MEAWSSQQVWMAIAVLAVVLFVVSVIARIRALSKQSAEIHKTLDYSKMKKWEDDDDWSDSSASSDASTEASSTQTDRFK